MRPLHLFYAIAIAVIWGSNFAVTKIAMQDMPPLFFAAFRYSLIVFPLIFFVKRAELSWGLIFKIGVFIGIFTLTFVFIGMKYGVSAGVASLLMQAQIIFTITLSTIFLKDSPSKATLLGIAIAFIGVIYLLIHESHSPHFLGILFILAASFCSGGGKILMKKNTDYNPFRLIIWMSLIPPIPLFLLSVIFETGQWEGLLKIDMEVSIALFYNAFISTFLGIGLTGYLLQLYSANLVAPYTLLVPIFGFLMGYFLLGETIEPSAIIGSGFILSGLIIPHAVDLFYKKSPSN